MKLKPLTRSIRELITLGGLAIVSSSAGGNDARLNPNEIWINPNPPGPLEGICAQDIDQDGDLDILKLFSSSIALLENIGTPISPEFSLSIPYANNLSELKFKAFGLNNCLMYNQTLIDIDADGDLDLFRIANKVESKFDSVRLKYFKNEGTTKQPIFHEASTQTLFNLPENLADFMFKDIDRDGDQDFWNNIESSRTTFYENTGTPENAFFIERNISPVAPVCQIDNFGTRGLGFLVDLNRDGQFDMLCRNRDQNLSYFESSNEGFLTEKNLFNPGFFGNISNPQAIDINKDGNIDLLGSSFSHGNVLVIYSNLGTDSIPTFKQGQIYATLPPEIDISSTHVVNLDSDDDLDLVFVSSPEDRISYAINDGNNINPNYSFSNSGLLFEQCNNSLSELVPSGRIGDIELTDIDSDSDLDLFITIKPTRPISAEVAGYHIVYCENQGNSNNPNFSAGRLNPFGFKKMDSISLSFSDLDTDGDQDAIKSQSGWYENIGDSNEPFFRLRQWNYLEFPSYGVGLDFNGDGHIESFLIANSNHPLYLNHPLFFKGLEPVTKITATTLKPYSSSTTSSLIIATLRPSQLQIQNCLLQPNNACSGAQKIILPETAKEIALTTGHFFTQDEENILLAMIDSHDKIKIRIYNRRLELLTTGSGGIASSISASAGQLDEDPEDEGVISFIQDDGRAVAVSFNIDGSILGTAVTNQGKQTSITVGQFDTNAQGFALAYLTPDNKIETATFKGNGTLIGQGFGGKATYVSVNSANILGSPLDEYIISLNQPNGIAGLIGFDSSGQELGRITGNVMNQPKTLPGNFFGQTGLAVSSILSDNRAAISFLTNQGQHIATGTSEAKATQATLAIADSNNDGIDEGLLIYIDEAGFSRLEIFSSDGKNLSYK